MRKIFWLLPTALLAATLSATGYSADESKKGTSDQANTSAAADTAAASVMAPVPCIRSLKVHMRSRYLSSRRRPF